LCKATAENILKSEILTGKKPITVGAVAVYIILRKSPEHKKKLNLPFDIAKILEISETSIKSAFKELEPFEQDILPLGMNIL
jgi:transcription initiation factor TFIIIB Brf1 subunit/transcription initiation factor TFIIB